MADPYKIKQGDTRPVLRMTLTRNGVPVDTTGWTAAKLLMRPEAGGSVLNITLAFVTPRTGGLVDATFSSANTSTNGVYDCEIETTQGSGLIETFPNGGYFQIEIVDDLG